MKKVQSKMYSYESTLTMYHYTKFKIYNNFVTQLDCYFVTFFFKKIDPHRPLQINEIKEVI